MMSDYKEALSTAVSELKLKPVWDQHIPDELCALIHSTYDFQVFLDFISNKNNWRHIEYGCEDTQRFVERLAIYQTDPDVIAYADEKGIHSKLGKLAYSMILAIGNE